MGDVIDLDRRRAGRRPRARRRAILYVDLADPLCYLTILGVERSWPHVRLRLACSTALARLDGTLRPRTAIDTAHALAAHRKVPLAVPDPLPADVGPAMRAASHAVGAGRGREFLLAASRLAFGGGYDLRTPEVLAEAAAAAGVGLDATLAAAVDPRWAAPVDLATALLFRAGVRELPALHTGDGLVWGEPRVRARLLVS